MKNIDGIVTTSRVTKKDRFLIVKEILEDASIAGDERVTNEILDFIDKQIALIDKKAATAKKRADEKRAAGDPLYSAIESLIDDSLQTVEVIYSKVKNVEEGVTKSKVIARLNRLVSEGKAAKQELKIDNNKKMAYTLPSEEENIADDENDSDE